MAYSLQLVAELGIFKHRRQPAEQRFQFPWIQHRVFDLQDRGTDRNQARVGFQQLFEQPKSRSGVTLLCCPQPQVIRLRPHHQYSFREVHGFGCCLVKTLT
jgi:hypothetical protein